MHLLGRGCREIQLQGVPQPVNLSLYLLQGVLQMIIPAEHYIITLVHYIINIEVIKC